MAVFTEQTKVHAGVYMARLSITQAIEQSGVSRTHFYTHYIKKGLISVSEHNGKKYIDSSELLRVFPDLATEQPPNNTEQTKLNTPEQKIANNTEQIEQIKLLREQVADLKADKAFLQSQVVSLTNRLPAPAKKQNWFMRFWTAKDDE